MSFICQKCKDIAQEKANKLVTQIRKVIYNTPCKDITNYNNSDKITTGQETVKEIYCCSKCFKEHEKDTPDIVGEEKQVYVKNKSTKKRSEKTKKFRKYNENYDDEEEYNPEKYDEGV